MNKLKHQLKEQQTGNNESRSSNSTNALIDELLMPHDQMDMDTQTKANKSSNKQSKVSEKKAASAKISNRHTKSVNSKLKPHQCELCDYATFYKSDLAKHMRIHKKKDQHIKIKVIFNFLFFRSMVVFI